LKKLFLEGSCATATNVGGSFIFEV